ncbi:MAG TPA: hypothetical protein VGR35_09720 [Tepidisphaeraceae bacterium]|nr:hypothetical protein [Tepidisphaeraceae bacterium]
MLGSVVGGDIWLRGGATDELLDAALRRLAPQARYALTDGDKLTPLGNLLPVGELPAAEWVPLAQLLEIDRPAPALPAPLVPTVPLRLARGGRPRPATHLLVRITDFARYADAAPGVRLRPLRFAATDDEAIVAGTPLPSVPGVACWESSGVIAPCGWEWFPAVDPATVRRVLALQPDELAFFRADGTWHLLRRDNFVAAQRSAIRATVREGRP